MWRQMAEYIGRNTGELLPHIILHVYSSMFKEDECHARMREILSYVHIPKTMSMCYMYEATYSD